MRRTVVAFAALMGIALGGWTLVDRDNPAGAAPRDHGRHGGWGDGWRGRHHGPDEHSAPGEEQAGGMPTGTPTAGPTTGPMASGSPTGTTGSTGPVSGGSAGSAGGGSSSGTPAAPTSSPSTAAGGAPAGGTTGGAAQGDEAEVVRLLNEERAKNGCGALRTDARLTGVAQAQSKDMADLDYFDHVRPDGTNKVGDRMTAAGFSWSWAGEVIAGGSAEPAGAVATWLRSGDHRAIVLNCTAAAIGVGRDPRGNLWTATLGTE